MSKSCGCGQGGQWSCEQCRPGEGDLPSFDYEIPDSWRPEKEAHFNWPFVLAATAIGIATWVGIYVVAYKLGWLLEGF